MNPEDPLSAIGEIIRSVALSVAEAQWELDKSSMVVAELMTGQQILRDPDTGQPMTSAGEPVVRDSRVYFGHHVEDGHRVPSLVSMMELGFTPNFYQFVDTVIEVKLALKLRRARYGRTVLHANTVDAGYASTYSFNADLTSSVRTKIVPIPPPALLDERIHELLAQRQDEAPTPETSDAEVPTSEPSVAPPEN